jgi:hypothetical protein
MEAFKAILLTDLRHLIRKFGADGGLTSPSIYDTAQVLRLAPPAQDTGPTVDWLLDQQQPDGGWGKPTVPRARDLPTLAALLALHHSSAHRRTRDAIQAGQDFISRQATIWEGSVPDDLTAGAELLLPMLFEEAARAGLAISPAPYRELIALGNRRRAYIASKQPKIGTTPLHSWEAWGDEPDPDLVDDYGSVGHSPAATARWLYAAQRIPELAPARSAAQNYLERAAEATGAGLPGIMPTCWPTPHFEQAFGLHALYIAGLLNHPSLTDAVEPQITSLAQALTPVGIGFSDTFAPDGDDTAATIAALHATGRPADIRILQRFANGDHFCAWPGELQPSLSVTAHAVHTLRLFGHDTDIYERYIIAHQLPDGRWPGDKWNGSWLYTSWRCIIALQAAARATPIRRAVGAILSYQRPDGGWGSSDSNSEETAYATLALRSLGRCGMDYAGLATGLARGERWLQQQYRPFAPSTVACWLAKEPYRPRRISRVIELSALLTSFDSLPNAMA